MGHVIGIDLGTTNSAVAYLKKDKPEIIINEKGKRTTPSVVGIINNETIVGETALNQYINKPDKTIKEIKKFMGTVEKIELDGKEYSPQEISAMILRYLKVSVENYLGEEVTEAVITVPAKFDNLQRQATKDAGEIAGLKVERIINEPTAAALAFGLENMDCEAKVLVYDFGGGTFDVTILEMFEGVLDVISSKGNNDLGGKDIDRCLADYIIKDFERKEGINLKSNDYAQRLIIQEAEKAKINLSHSEMTEIILDFIPGVKDKEGFPIGINMRICRKELELLIKDLIKSTEVLIDKAMAKDNLSSEDIDVVLAVGGSTRIPYVRKLLENKFGSRVRYDINPDEVVAVGAAIQGGIKTGKFDAGKDILITDVCPYTLGTSVVSDVGGRLMSGVYDPLIIEDSTIPVSKKKIYNTLYDNQKSVNVEAYQGDELLAENNKLIGKFNIDGIPEGKAGEEEIEVEFSYDLNGILRVKVKILSTGKEKSKIFNLATMSQEEIAVSKESLDKSWKKSKLSNKVKVIIDIAERKIPDLEEQKRKDVENILNNLKKALTEDNEELVDKYDDELTDILFDIE